ncbi:MAG: NnrU family protein, partial [Chromatiaceae bacterium]|nr:NnrU family protein [Chromatiaceae bacterium]
WTRHLSLLIMLPVFPLLLATYLPGRIQAAVVHPMLTAVIVWALAHLTANGNLADLVLFGSFLAWSLADRISLLTRQAPAVQGAPRRTANDLIAIGAGLALYVVFLLWAHKWLFGVSPLGIG